MKKKKKERLKYIYDQITDLVNLRKQSQKYFNDRTLMEFIDDNERRWNSYTPTREEQGKEPWQSNFFHPTTQAKVKAIIASAASTIPKINIKATNINQQTDKKRADIIKNLVKHSYTEENLVDTTQTQNFFEALDIVSLGTVFTHCTYESITKNRKTITSYDLKSGEYEVEIKKELVKDQCSDEIVPINEMYVSSMLCKNGNIQAQPSLARIKYYTESEFEEEYGEYKKFEDVKIAKQIVLEGDQDRYFYEKYAERIEEAKKEIEVIKFYSIVRDEYIIIANGIILIDVPMLWEYKLNKVYPYAKTIFEPFATNFFYGNALPNTLLGEQDVINSLYAMMIDKTYKTLDKTMLLGNQNRDSFDFDEQSINDRVIYVEDVNQAKELPVEGVNAGELNMLGLISKGLDSSSVDQNQSGIAGRGVTAREVVIANENAQKLGHIFRMFLSNHWRQKTILRIGNILKFYTQDKVDFSLGEKNAKTQNRIFNVEDTQLSNGQQGTLNIEMVASDREPPTREDLDAKEVAIEKEGGTSTNVEFIAIKSGFIENWHYDVMVVENSLEIQDQSIEQAKIETKLKTLAVAFPQLFMLNQEQFFKQTLEAFGENVSSYQTKIAPQPMQEQQQQEPPKQLTQPVNA